MKRKIVYWFRIELSGIEPLIWRLIEVPSSYNFWDLHVAMRDSMGWLDYHLHEFRLIPRRKRKEISIGIPDEDYGAEVLPGWEVSLSDHFIDPGDEAMYLYDFGDGWQHRVLLEGIHLPSTRFRHPVCLGGERACPPEDCGGIDGYYNLVEILANPKHKEYESMVSWLAGHAENYHPYDPERFVPSEVEFSDPKKRWKAAFGS